MTIPMAHERGRGRHLWRSVGAVAAGLLTTVVLSLGADSLFHAIGVFPPWFQPMASSLWLLAIAYRIVYGVAGGYITARLAPTRPMKHALVLGGIGLALSILGSAMTWNAGPEYGPKWYAFALAAIALPSVWLGCTLHARTNV